MNYLQSLLALDATALATFDFEAGPPVRVEQPSSAATARLLQALWREAATAATFIAVSASIANVLADRSVACPVNVQAFETYVLPQTPIFASALPGFIAGDQLAELSEPYQDFEARIGLARRMALAFAREAHGRPAERTVDLVTLQDALHNAAAAASTLMAGLVDSCRTLPLDMDFAAVETAHPRLSNLLLAVARGGHPCVEADGCVIVPGWAERRHHARYGVDFDVEIETSLGIYSAKAFDAGQGGIGLDGGISVEIGDTINVRIPDGRTLNARIAWVAGSRSGATFIQPLGRDDPLLRCLA